MVSPISSDSNSDSDSDSNNDILSSLTTVLNSQLRSVVSTNLALNVVVFFSSNHLSPVTASEQSSCAYKQFKKKKSQDVYNVTAEKMRVRKKIK